MPPRKRAEPRATKPATSGTARDSAAPAKRSAPRKTAAKTARAQQTIEPSPVFDSVLAETDAAIAAAKEAGHLGTMDLGAIAVIRELAHTIDKLRDRPAVDADGKALPIDNVTVPTYLRFAEQLGLTPAGRRGLEAAPAQPKASKLGTLRSIRGGAAGADAAKPKRSTGRRS